MRQGPFFKIKRRVVYFLVNHVFVGTKHFSVKRRLLNSIRISVGEGTKVVGPLYCTGRLTIGKDCWVGHHFRVEGNGEVTIGDRCDIAPDVTFFTGGHEIGSTERRAGTGTNYRQRVGDGTWLGARTTIVNETRVGCGCIVAACACVVHDVEDHTLVGGVPAKPIRKLPVDTEASEIADRS